MRLYLSSLRTRLILLTAVTPSLLLLAFLGGTLHTANDAVGESVRRSLSDAGSVFMKLLETRKNELSMMAAVTARDPRFFATFAIPEDERGPEFAPTVEGIAFDFLRITDADFIEVFDARGAAIVHVERTSGLRSTVTPTGAAVQRALDGIPSADFKRVGDHLEVAGVAPVFVSGRIAAVLRLGSVLDRTFADEVKRLTGAEVCLTHAGAELASTYTALAPGQSFVWHADADAPRSTHGDSFDASAAHTLRRGDVRYLVVRIGLRGADAADSFDAFLGRELETELRPMVALSTRLAIAGALAIIITGLAAYLVARRVAQPLSEIVAAALALQRGDYDQPLVPRGADEVAFLGRSFLEMRQSLRSHVEHLRSLDQMKGNFIALAGHELKTPLTVITSFNEMIVSGSLGAVPDNIRDPMRRIQERLWDLNRLVEDILDMSRFEQGLFEFRKVVTDPRELVVGILQQRRTNLQERDVRVVSQLGDGEVRVHGDPERLTQAVTNLVDNAIRFTPDGGTVTVTVTADADHARIAVRDTGVGIAAQELEWLFTKSQEIGEIQHHSSGRLRFGSRGLGLGLALCKAIVEGHGGSVHVHSVPGRGSEFTLVLPLYRGAAVPAEPVLV